MNHGNRSGISETAEPASRMERGGRNMSGQKSRLPVLRAGLALAAAALAGLAFLLALWRFLVGPTAADRVVAFDVLTIVSVTGIGLVALVQTDMKKLVAYSSISHMGFVTLGMFLFTGSQLNTWALEGALVQMVSHGFVSAGMFFCIGVMYDRVHSRVATAPPLRRTLFHWAVEVGRHASRHRLAGTPMPLGLKLKHRLADTLVLGKIRAAMGGRVRGIISGAARRSRCFSCSVVCYMLRLLLSAHPAMSWGLSRVMR